MPAQVQATRGHYRMLIIGAYLTGTVITGAGVALAVVRPDGDTLMKFLGQTFESTSVGITAIFIGAVVVMRLIGSATRSLDRTTAGERD